jgi:antitoxin component of MazEF toxin-antitoxin module
MEESMKKYVTRVEVDGDSYVILFPPQLLEDMNLSEGDVMVWEIADDGAITIKKTNIKANF